jgi:S-(hydroxymethyl)glutathione dehydrogenase/alcohol dehydrogenase
MTRSRMRAAVLRKPGAPLEVRDDVEIADPGPGEVEVRIVASGVCHTDRSVQQGALGDLSPVMLGHEGAGEIVRVGPGVEDLSPGDHVIVAWIAPCGSCRSCLRGQPFLCESNVVLAPQSRYWIDGEVCHAIFGTATFAERTVPPAAGVVRIPKDVPLEVAALVGCAVVTGVGAVLKTGNVSPGESVLVVGCGGVGLCAVQGARLAGASDIVAVDRFETKLDMARRFGATHVSFPAGLPDLSRELTGGAGFDHAFEVVGRPETIRLAWDHTRRGGETVIVGAGRFDESVSFTPFELFFSCRKLVGCQYGSADPRVDFHRLIQFWRRGQLDLEGLITRRIRLEQVNEAFRAMESGEVARSVILFE